MAGTAPTSTAAPRVGALNRLVCSVAAVAAVALTAMVAVAVTLEDLPGWLPAVAVVALWVAAASVTLPIRFNSHRQDKVWTEAALVLTVSFFPVLWVPAAVGVGTLIGKQLLGQSVQKTLYNTAVTVLGSTTGVVVFLAVHTGGSSLLSIRGVAALALAGLAHALVEGVLIRTVLGVALGESGLRRFRAGFGISQLPDVATVTMAIGVVVVAQWRIEALLLLPPAVWAVRSAHRTRLRLEEHEDHSRQLETATHALNDLDEQGVLTALSRAAEDLFGPDRLEVVLTDGPAVTGSAGTGSAVSGSAVTGPARATAIGAAPGSMVSRPLHAGDTALGELRLLFDGTGIVLSEQEDRSLSTLATAASVALHNARQHSRARYEADHDPLTGLLNRRGLLAAASAALSAGGGVSLLLVDLDRFKEINDTLGHGQGDLLLSIVGERLRAGARPQDTVARLGGDEFAMLLPDCSAVEGGLVARRISALIRQPVGLGPVTLSVGASIGVASDRDGSTVGELLRCADVAMYAAKAAGDGVRRYDAAQDPASVERLLLEPELRAALAGGEEIVTMFQPQLDLETGAPVGAEALVRWSHPVYGLVMPDAFLPVIERCGLHRELTLRVLDAALTARADWATTADVDVPVSVNLTARNLLDPRLPEEIAALLRRHRTTPSDLVLEIPETVVLSDLDVTATVLRDLDALGVQLSLDDFGTGGAPLTLLAQVPLRELKIDRSFVAAMAGDTVAATIVRGTVDLAHSLGLRVVAEGVENAAQAEALGHLGCDAVQGFLYAPALSADAVPAVLRTAARDAQRAASATVISMAAHRDGTSRAAVGR